MLLLSALIKREEGRAEDGHFMIMHDVTARHTPYCAGHGRLV